MVLSSEIQAILPLIPFFMIPVSHHMCSTTLLPPTSAQPRHLRTVEADVGTEGLDVGLLQRLHQAVVLHVRPVSGEDVDSDEEGVLGIVQLQLPHGPGEFKDGVDELHLQTLREEWLKVAGSQKKMGTSCWVERGKRQGNPCYKYTGTTARN